jgi:aerobic carbon-monoxide dehydrogenase medium subunit
MTSIELREPTSLDEACASLDELGEDARLIAGGTALVLFMRQRLVQPACLVSLQRLDDLRGIRNGATGLSFGALATHAEAAESSLVRAQYAALAETFARVATPRIRNAGTIGGNLAHGDPHLDPPVTLLALDAAVTAHSSHSPRRIPLRELFVDYYETSLRQGEVLTEIHVPPRQPGDGLAFLKFLPRSQDDYAVVGLAAWVRLGATGALDEVRLALGSVGSVPFRAAAAETLLTGQPVDPDPDVLVAAGEAAAAAADPEDDVRGSARYKREVIKVLVGRVITSAVADARG